MAGDWWVGGYHFIWVVREGLPGKIIFKQRLGES